MANPLLPTEISEYIVDFLSNDAGTLKQCCLVSKSWVPCARKHIFRKVYFIYPADLEPWKKAFPDTSNSPAYYTRFLYVGCIEVVTAEDAEEGGWIRAFSNVVRLVMWNDSVVFPSQVLALVCSLPRLEDLELRGKGMDNDADDHTIFQPSTSPPLTGILALSLTGGVEQTVRQLLDLPNGIRLQGLKCTLYSEQDLRWVVALVQVCSDTLEDIDIDDVTCKDSWAPSIDFSKATKLRRVTFRTFNNFITWATIALKTISTDHRGPQEVSIHTQLYSQFVRNISNPGQTFGEGSHQRWVDLDHVLVQLAESHAARVKIVYNSRGEREELLTCIKVLLPGITMRRGTELVDFIDL